MVCLGKKIYIESINTPTRARISYRIKPEFTIISWSTICYYTISRYYILLIYLQMMIIFSSCKNEGNTTYDNIGTQSGEMTATQSSQNKIKPQYTHGKSTSKIDIEKISQNFDKRFVDSIYIKDQSENFIYYKNLLETLKEWEEKQQPNLTIKIGNNNYKFINYLGSGFYYRVYSVMPENSDGELYVLKVPKNNARSTNTFIKKENQFYQNLLKNNLHFLTVKSKLIRCKHKNITRYKNLIIKEYVPGTEIAILIIDPKITITELTEIFRMLLSHACILVDKKIVNFDMNLGNFIITNINGKKSLKVIDVMDTLFEGLFPDTIKGAFLSTIAVLICFTDFKTNSLIRNKYLSNKLNFSSSFHNLFSDILSTSHRIAAQYNLMPEHLHVNIYKYIKCRPELLKFFESFWKIIDYAFCHPDEFIHKENQVEKVNKKKLLKLYDSTINHNFDWDTIMV